ncbi:phytase [Undibacterium aquatile]|uniref:Phytase n=1 Tax=Undibacterium aquatile TaxID=1537398 RepID=A0ABR6XHV7_9BURK|nr:phytase [Undibacterium aquatile]
MRTLSLQAHLLLALSLLTLSPLSNAASPAPSLHTYAKDVPVALQRAQELVRLPDGGWLMLDKNSLRLMSADGTERARFPVRAKHLDTRPHPQGAYAMLLEAETQRSLPFIVDTHTGELLAQPALPSPAFALESSCLYRDAQQQDHVFLIGKEGISEQWIRYGSSFQLLRRLALPPHIRHCRSDDTQHTLYVSTAETGVWAVSADAENLLHHWPVETQRTAVKISEGASTIVALAGGVAIVDEQTQQLHRYHQQGTHWEKLASQPLQQSNLSKLARATSTKKITTTTSSELPLLLRKNSATKAWQMHTISWNKTPSTTDNSIIIAADAQTEVVARYGDAADDPAIWVHPSDPAQSRILGTNKKQGLLVYNLQGKQLQSLESGRLNNVDVRQNIHFENTDEQQRFDLALATQRDDNSLALYTIANDGEVREAARLPTTLEKIYGFCLYRPQSGGLEAFVNDKDGRYQQYRIRYIDGNFSSQLVRSFKLATQPEGCVVDDQRARIFIGEEKHGIWVTSADAEQAAILDLVMPVGKQLVADVEGLALYQGKKSSYLLVSSQGDNSYLVLNAQPPYQLRGKFRIGTNLSAGIDGTSETDGIEVSSAYLGSHFPKGMLVVQDGYKRLPDGPQNFKYVRWESIADRLHLED